MKKRGNRERGEKEVEGRRVRGDKRGGGKDESEGRGRVHR